MCINISQFFIYLFLTGSFTKAFIHFYKQANITQPPKASIKYLLKSPMWAPGNEKFEVEVTSWSRDIHGLFDFQGRGDQFKITRHQVSNHCKIYRNSVHNQHYFDSKNRKLPKYFDFICQLDKTQDQNDQHFWLKWNPPLDAENLSKSEFKVPRDPYIVLNDFKVKNPNNNEEINGYPLESGDTLKMGLSQFTIREMRDGKSLNSVQMALRPDQSVKTTSYVKDTVSTISQQSQVKKVKKESEADENEQENSHTRAKKRIIKKESKTKTRKKRSRSQGKTKFGGINSDEESSEMIEEQSESPNKHSHNLHKLMQGESQVHEKIKEECKFCLVEDYNSDQDPFISPCQCKGSVRRVHLTCFMEWISSKVTITDRNSVKTYHLMKNTCEVCKMPYPEAVAYGDKEVSLINIERPAGPYLLLQNVKQKENEKQIMYIMIPGVQSRPIKIGRGDSNEVKLSDISISRDHSQIFYKDGKFYIKDLRSKFGTLLKFEKDRLFNFQPAQVQVGRIFYKISPLIEKSEPEESQCE